MKKIILKNVHGKLSLFAVLVAFISFLTSCDKDIADLNPDSSSTQGLEKSMHIHVSDPNLLVSGLQGSSGSAIGPDGALYVTEGAVGKISRINPRTGEITTFASGFPLSLIGIGGVYDVAFLGKTAYALVTLVDDPTLFPTGEVNGIYRVDGPDSVTVIADIGTYNIKHPPTGFDFYVSTGVQYSIQTYHDGFLVTDGHLNRVLYVTRNGKITEFKTFDNIVPTGLAVSGNTVYMAEAGPTPHNPEDGKVVSFGLKSHRVKTVASGAPLLVDVEFGRGQTLFALSQGIWEGAPEDAGTPANPDTGSLVKVNSNGTFTTITEDLDRPTSLEISGNTAYIITLTGEVWTVENIAGQPFGHDHWKSHQHGHNYR